VRAISGGEAIALWKEAGLWAAFPRASRHIGVASPRGKGNRRTFYGQKNYPNPERNFAVILDCRDDEELERVASELRRRVLTLPATARGSREA
jgi:hypothetical protein